jgi:hypothetical protein
VIAALRAWNTRLRGGLAATPGRMRAVAAGGVVTLLLLGAVGFLTAQERAGALSSARDDSAQVVRLQTILGGMVRAHAAATDGFLRGGPEPTDQRQEYETAIDGVSRTVTAAVRQGRSGDAADLATVNQSVSRYAVDIAAARANNRQQLPVGSAFLKQGTTELRGTVMPTLSALTARATVRVEDSYRLATWMTALLVAEALVCLLVLVLVQRWLAHRTHRVFSPPLVAATVAVLAVALGGGAVLITTQLDADRARHTQYQATIALATARTDAFDARSDESLTLINRGVGQKYQTEFTTRILQIRAQLARAGTEGVTTSAASTALGSWLSTHQKIRALDDAGHWDAAVALATRDGSGGAGQQFHAFDTATEPLLTAQAAEVSDVLGDTLGPTHLVAWATLVLGLLAAIACWWGFSQRLEEYR